MDRIRSFFAILIAYVVASSTAMAIGILLFIMDPQRVPTRLALTLAMATLALGGFAAGVLAGWISARSPITHALAIAAILAVAATLAAVLGVGAEPAWYRIAAVGMESLFLPLGAFAGARHRRAPARRRRSVARGDRTSDSPTLGGP